MERTTLNAARVVPCVAGFVLGVGVGGLCGYLLLRNQSRKAVDREVEEVKQYYRKRPNDPRYDAYLASLKLAENLGYGSPSATDDEFSAEIDEFSAEIDGGSNYRGYEPGPDLDTRADAARVVWPPPDRDTAKPYRIAVEEYSEEEETYEKLSMTWFEGDNVLTDDKDQPVRDVNGTTGPLRLEDFGGVSEDPHVMYVRNHRLEVDFEIILDRRNYLDAILNYGNPSLDKNGG